MGHGHGPLSSSLCPSTTFCLEMELHDQPIRSESRGNQPDNRHMIWLIIKLSIFGRNNLITHIKGRCIMQYTDDYI